MCTINVATFGELMPMDLITVCACTYRRPDQLEELLNSFKQLKTPPGTEVRVCIVDNDIDTSAEAVVNAFSGDLPFSLKYVHEQQPGIPSARNRALAEACDSDFLVFVDDDETVDPHWLVELHKVAIATSAAFVQGPVDMTVEDPADSWWLDTIFFQQRIYPDRSVRKESWSNNVMLNVSQIAPLDCQFDDQLRYDGGSDTLFFQDIVRKGGIGRYAAKARVFEIQPKSRLNWRWALQRQFRFGVTRVNTLKLRYPAIKMYIHCFIRGAGMLVWGIGNFVLAIIRGKRSLADGMAYFARASGVFLGSLGVRREEYARKSAS